MAEELTSKEVILLMTQEEKTSLCSGQSFWHTKAVKRIDLQSIIMADGPHGLRKPLASSEHSSIFNSELTQLKQCATCFPSASGTANSFNPELLKKIGEALGEECLQESVSVILGPGVNIKRSPLCGRNFEYFSEDPFLCGELSAAFIEGVQSTGTGASVKHFAANNQEWCRLACDSVVDQRALREIYLSAFEKSVKQSQPRTVMCSYNKINGIYASENKWLLTEVLRDEWGFNGIVVSDWGAVVNRVKGINSGLDLEMPGSGGVNDALILNSVRNGGIREDLLDKTVRRILDLILKSLENKKQGFLFDADAHHALAKEAAVQSGVLLKNEGGILPLKGTAKAVCKQSLAVIGAFAKEPRFQGAGSSRVNPSKMENIFDSLKKAGLNFDYADGYNLTPFCPPDDIKIAEACDAAKGKDVVIIVTGLPAEYEGEGFDRASLDMPESHLKLIDAVSEVNSNIAVVLQLGAPVVMPWADKARGILVSYLGGQASGAACADLLLGHECPCGKLAETWPKALSDTPCFNYFPGGTKSVQYRESIFVGYRYYDTADKDTAYPFGHGLSYTSFEYSDLEIKKNEVVFTVTNTGKIKGAEIAQLYIAKENSGIFRAAKELKGFARVELGSGKCKKVSIPLEYGTEGTIRSFAYYNTAAKKWAVEGGDYTIYIGASSRDMRLKGIVKVDGDGLEQELQKQKETVPVYFSLPKAAPLEIPESQFTALTGYPLPALNYVPGSPFTLNDTLHDLQTTSLGKTAAKGVMKAIVKHAEGMDNENSQIIKTMMLHMPLRSIISMSGGKFKKETAESVLTIANGKPFSGMINLIKSLKN